MVPTFLLMILSTTVTWDCVIQLRHTAMTFPFARTQKKQSLVGVSPGVTPVRVMMTAMIRSFALLMVTAVWPNAKIPVAAATGANASATFAHKIQRELLSPVASVKPFEVLLLGVESSRRMCS